MQPAKFYSEGNGQIMLHHVLPAHGLSPVERAELTPLALSINIPFCAMVFTLCWKDRFENAIRCNDQEAMDAWQHGGGKPRTFHSGDLRGLINKINTSTAKSARQNASTPAFA